ncbi:MAG: T9SS type A sorting domain-containing protein [Saprospiraceae bacterium]
MKKGFLLVFAIFVSSLAYGQAPQPLPFSQNWSNAALITVDDMWGGVPGIQGRRGDGITAGTGIDPQTLLAADDPGVVDVNANRADPNTFATGGTTEFDGIGNPVVGLAGSGTADAPYLLLAINTTGLISIQVSYNLRDLDASVDNAVQQVALHYRIGNSGPFINLPAGYVADATTGPSLAVLVTAVNVTLPTACDNQPEVQLRIMTTNAVGNDEWVGIDDISIAGTAACDLDDAGLTDVGCEDNNETGNDDTDDYIWFQLNPTGTGLATTYSVSVNIGSVTEGSSNPPTNILYGVSTFFRLQAGSAGSGNVTVTITDDGDDNCTIDALIEDPGSCSVPFCELTGGGLTDVKCEDNNETGGDQTDDFIWFQLNPTGIALSADYHVTVNTGSVLWNGTDPAFNIPYGASEYFRLQQGSAGAGDVLVTITDASGIPCTFTVLVEDPGSCSIVNCDIEITNIDVTHETCPDDDDGTITVTATCTTCESIEYSIDGTNWFPNGVFTGLSPGTYSIFVRDTGDPDCTDGDEATINPGDDDPPVFDQDPLPQDETIECSDDVPPAATLTATDAVDPDVPVVFDEDTIPGNCPQEYTLVRTWTATDDCNNSVQHTQTITVEDNTAPVLNNLPDINVSVECDQDLPDVPNVTASDLCDTDVSVMFSESTEPGGCPQEYMLFRTWTATDDCQNATSFTQTISITDDTAPIFNQDPLPQDMTVSCSDIPMPEVLDGTDNCDPGIPAPVIFINEFHYDNTGGDVGEFIEIAGTAGTDLSQYQIVLYNGTGGAPYNTLVLSGVIDDEGSGFGAVSFAYPVNGIQNGAPDGIVLATTTGMVLQFLSYEGAFVAVGGVANGMMSTDIAVLELGSEPVGMSLQLTGTGQQYGDFTWVGPIAQSPGTLNAGQTINPLPGVILAMFSQMIDPGDCNGESTITRMWQLTDACGNSITHTQILTVTDTEGPSFSPPPLPMDITLSCEDPVPPAPMLTAADLCDIPGMQMEDVWINEIHYDNVGGDVGEFIEIAGTAGTDLANYTLVLYNGAGGASYNTLVLGGIIPNLANGFGTVCFGYPVNGIQNGAPDGMALVQNAGNMVLQFLSYEGVFMATNGPANGMMSTDIGVDEEPPPAIGTSLYLTGNGDDYSDFTWTGPLAATNCGVNTGQTFIPASQGPVVTFEESEEPGDCPQERMIFRTWTATDDCGNETVLNQVINIVDETAPIVNCPADLVLNLDIFGNASLDITDINFTYSDNCATVDELTVIPFPTQFFDCDDEGTTRQLTISVEDPCGNVGSCTFNVTIAPFSRCTPVILITDPCVCKNNATTLSNGQFGETIKIESLAGKTWTVIANTGLYLANSPAPPSAPILIPIGTVFVENPVPSGDYYLSGVHVDALGYSITVRSERGEILMIGNSCQYPNPTITADLSGPFCLFSDPVALTGTPGDANIVSEGFTVNGVPATEFDPGQGVGQYVIVYRVDGGVPKAFGPNDPGCVQTITVFVNVIATPANLSCNDLVYISLDNINCSLEITPDMILEGSYGCFDDYIVEIDKTLPYGNGPWEPGFIDANDIGKTYQVRVTHLVSGNRCWGNVKIEDKLPPVLSCENFSVPCNTPDLSADYLFNTLGIYAAFPVATDCQSFDLTYIDSDVTQNCASGLSKIITRKWTAIDASGNTSTCEQTIGLLRPTLADVTLPPDYDGFDAPGFNCVAAYPTPDWIEGQGLQGYPHVFGLPSGCNINWVYNDWKIEICDGTYKIRREWTIVDWCITDFIILNQLIKVEDKQGPEMICPPNTTVSVDPFQCCGTINLPDLIIEDLCSQLNNISGMVVTFDPQTNQQTGMYTFGGTLQDFAGNNWWDRDTLAAFGLTPCLPIGNQTVTYIAEDDCGNSTTCTFRLSVQDLVPPVAACDQFTTVTLTAGGTAQVHASTFDDGSYDACAPVFFKARRMASNGCQSNGLFYDVVDFCCEDVGDTIVVVFRVYDVPVAAGAVSNTLQENHANDCMVWVEVQDKIKPSCLPPAQAAVNCENFDPSLWAYGIPQVDDNCCLDTAHVYQGQEGLTHSTNNALFDTVCNRGTITRTFRVFDCHGNSSQCTQRVIVTYEQDYFLKFPNDAIITICSDSGRYDEPKFFGEDCELLGVSYEDEIFEVLPDACFKIERNWTIINWCTYNPNLACIYVPNPNPNAITNHPTNLPGPTVSTCGTLAPWAPTIVRINPTDPTTTNFCSFWEKNANCYKYKQIIKVIDGHPPKVDHCPSDTLYCDVTANNPGLWNNIDWWDNNTQSHDLCEGPADLTIVGKDLCSGPNITAHYLLFLDLDNDGTMETVVNSLNPPPPGLIYFNNINTPSYGGGTPRQFDNRGLPLNQNYQFTLLGRFNSTGTKRMFSVRWNTLQFPNVYTIPEFPHGTHKIKWFIKDGCGNEVACEYTFTVKDCKPPTVVCLNGLSVNIMPTGMIQLWASDFLQYTEDNCTPAGQLKIGVRKCGSGTGFPLDSNGDPITSVNFTCAEIGTQCVELWAIDASGNADYCETYLIVQDNLGNCGTIDRIDVAGAIKTEMTEGVEEAMVMIEGTSSFTPPYSFFDLSDGDGEYQVMNNVPVASTFTIAPEKDDNPLNGVTTYDLVLISKHILHTEVLDSPFKMIAADANKSGSITTFDIVEIRKLILGIYQVLPNNKSWRFVDYGFSFPNPENPFETAFPESISIADAMTNHMHEDFMGVKVGDVNNTAIANATMQAEERTVGTALFDINPTPSPSPNGEGSADRGLKAGETTEVTFKSAQTLLGLQFTLRLDGLEMIGLKESEHVSANNFGNFGNAVTVSVDDAQEFTLQFRALKSGKLSEMLGVSGSITRAEAYAMTPSFGKPTAGKNDPMTSDPISRLGIAFRFDGKTINGLGFELYQNQPNPFVNKTSIGFYLPEAADATLTVFDETGRAVYQQKGQFSKGENSIALDRALLNTTGVLYYKLETATDMATKKMIQAK